MASMSAEDHILLSGGSLLRTPGRSSCRTDLDKGMIPGLSSWQCTAELTAASAVSMLPQLQDFGRTSSIHFSDNLARPLHADFLQWQTNARKLIRAYARAAAQFILKVAFVSWASRWQRFPDEVSPETQVASFTGSVERQEDAEVSMSEVHEKAQHTQHAQPRQSHESEELFFDAQHRAELAERQVLELEERLRQLAEQMPEPQAEGNPALPGRLVQSLLADGSCQLLRLVLCSWRSLGCRRSPATRRSELVVARRAAATARMALLAWFEFINWGATQASPWMHGTLTSLGRPGKEAALALRAFLGWASELWHLRRCRQAARAATDRGLRNASRNLAEVIEFAFHGWQSETFGRYSWLEMRRAHTSEEKWKRSATASLVMTAWHHRAQQCSRLRFTLSTKELAFQRLVLGAWRLALPDLQPGATPPRARMRPRPSPESSHPGTANLVVTPEDKVVSMEAQASDGAGAAVQPAPSTLLQQLHIHATRLLREKIKADGQLNGNSELLEEETAKGQETAKGHPKYMPTPSKRTAPRNQPTRSAKHEGEDRSKGNGPKAIRRHELGAGKGRASPRPTGKAPVAQSRLKLQELAPSVASPKPDAGVSLESDLRS